MEYIKGGANTCCFGSLESTLFDSGEYVLEQAIESRIEDPLVFESNGYADKIRFTNNIIIDKGLKKVISVYL